MPIDCLQAMSFHAFCIVTNFSAVKPEACQEQSCRCVLFQEGSGFKRFRPRACTSSFKHLQFFADPRFLRGNDIKGRKVLLFGRRNRCSVPPVISQSLENEEARWLREEQRWLREEQRWLREEARWNVERKAWAEHSAYLKEETKRLRQEIDGLQIKVTEDKQKDATLDELIVGLKGILQSLNISTTTYTKNSKAVPSSSTPHSSVEATKIDTSETRSLLESPSALESIKFVDSGTMLASPALSQTISGKGEPPAVGEVLTGNRGLQKDPVIGGEANSAANLSSNVKPRTLKKGSEGDDVKELQNALASLGFFPGEDDMEFSSFSSETESAVKSWQASIDVLEDGIVTARLLAKLLNESHTPVSENKKKELKKVVKIPVQAASNSSFSTKNHPDINGHNEKGNESQMRVYLLGENRWEDPGRLLSKGVNNTGVKTLALEKCFSCGGEGRTLCTECEGTGEINIEEHFLEWVDEGAKCPYCEGSGSLLCDACNGKGGQSLS